MINFLFLLLLNIFAVDFELRSLSNESKPFSSFVSENKPIFLTFWATWCGPCVEELTLLKNNFSHEIKVLAVNIDNSETASQVKPFLKSHPIPFEVFLDPEQKILSRFVLDKEVPFSILFSKEGKKLAEFRGMDPALPSKIRAILK